LWELLKKARNLPGPLFNFFKTRLTYLTSLGAPVAAYEELPADALDGELFDVSIAHDQALREFKTKKLKVPITNYNEEVKYLTDEQKNSIGTTLSEMSDDSSKIPKVIRDLITYSRTSNPDKDFYFLNEESPFSLGQFTEQLTGVSLDRDSPDSNIILVWDQPNTRLSYITKEEASIPTRQTGDEGRGIGGDIEINEDNLALESRRREGRGRQRTLEWQAPPIDILEKAVQDVDLSSLTAGQLQTLSLMSDEKIAENLGLGENIRLRSPAMDASTRLPIISFNLLFRTKSQNRLNELGINLGSTRADPISQEFFDSFKALLIEGSKSYLEEE